MIDRQRGVVEGKMEREGGRKEERGLTGSGEREGGGRVRGKIGGGGRGETSNV